MRIREFNLVKCYNMYGIYLYIMKIEFKRRNSRHHISINSNSILYFVTFCWSWILERVKSCIVYNAPCIPYIIHKSDMFLVRCTMRLCSVWQGIMDFHITAWRVHFSKEYLFVIISSTSSHLSVRVSMVIKFFFK